jgi:hypothetical protein
MSFILGRAFKILLLISIQIPLIATGRAQTSVARSGTTNLDAASPNGRVLVVIETTIFDGACSFSCPAESALKELNAKQLSVVQALKISIDGKPVIAPHSVYDHLFEPHEATLLPSEKGFVLRIDGMDASNSYFVRIYFDRHGVHRFVTYWGEAPDKPTSDTRYYSVELK